MAEDVARDFMTVEEVRASLQVAQARAEELCQRSVRLRRESDRLLGRLQNSAYVLSTQRPGPGSARRGDRVELADHMG
jgi:hypothetical protein